MGLVGFFWRGTGMYLKEHKAASFHLYKIRSLHILMTSQLRRLTADEEET